jgi:tetratricopeptide (TPR) repeat protein
VKLDLVRKWKWPLGVLGVVFIAALGAAGWYYGPAQRATRLTREGLIAGREGDVYRASQLLYRAAKAEPGFFLARFNLGLALKSLGKHEQALQEFYAAAIIEPADPQTYYEIARIHALADRKESAIAALERSIDLGFDNIPMLNADREFLNVNKSQRFKDLWERWETRRQRPPPVIPEKK